MKRTYFPACAALLLAGLLVPLLVESQTGASAPTVRFLGLLLGVVGVFLWFVLRRIRLAALCITLLLMFQFANSLIRQHINQSGSIDSFVRKDCILLIAILLLGAVFPPVFFRIHHVILTRRFALTGLVILISLLYAPLIVLKIKSGASAATVISFHGIVPLEVVKVLVTIQLALVIARGGSNYSASIMATLIYLCNAVLEVFVLRETGSVIVLTVVFFVLMCYCGYFAIGGAAALGIGGGLTLCSYLGGFMAQLKTANPAMYDSVPSVLRTVATFYNFFLRRFEQVDSAAGSGTQVGYARSAMARAGLFHGYGSLGYLPQGDTDMALAGCVESFGVLAGFLLLLLMLLLLLALLLRIKGPLRAPSTCVQLAITTLFTTQTILMIGGSLGLLPLTGLPLYFLARSTTANICAIGAVYLHECCAQLDEKNAVQAASKEEVYAL